MTRSVKGTQTEKNLLAVTQQRGTEPELDAKILQPGALVENSTRFGNQMQTPISAVEGSAAPAQSDNPFGKQQILLRDPIKARLIPKRTPVEMNQQICTLPGYVLRILQYQIQTSPPPPRQEQILGKCDIPPLIFPSQDDLPVQSRKDSGAENEEDAYGKSTLFHVSSIHYNRNAQNTT